jgi:hypothetical protein
MLIKHIQMCTNWGVLNASGCCVVLVVLVWIIDVFDVEPLPVKIAIPLPLLI